MIKKINILAVYFLLSCVNQKGQVKNKDLHIIINDVEYALYTVHDGDYNIRILVPSCKDCKIPFSIATQQHTDVTTVVIPPKEVPVSEILK